MEGNRCSVTELPSQSPPPVTVTCKLDDVKNLGQLNDHIDRFNSFLMKDNVMKALGFLLQFGEIDVHSFKGLIGKLFIRFAVKAFRIQATLLLGEDFYTFKLTAKEMYSFTELLHNFAEDETSANEQDNHLEQEEEEAKAAEDNLCPVCLALPVSTILPCLHGFCNECSKDWIQDRQKGSCPMCRQIVVMTQSKFKAAVLHFEADEKALLKEIRQQINAFIKNKNNSIPLNY